jgi:hypothetical protein
MLRFVAFVNEEPHYFQTTNKLCFAGRCRERDDKIAAMISPETIGYYSDESGPRHSGPGSALSAHGQLHRLRWQCRLALAFARCTRRIRQVQSLPAAAFCGLFFPALAGPITGTFWEHGSPGIMVTDTALFRYPHYHAATDTPDKLITTQ